MIAGLKKIWPDSRRSEKIILIFSAEPDAGFVFCFRRPHIEHTRRFLVIR